MLGISGTCFEPPIAEDESHEDTRYAELSEVMYIALRFTITKRRRAEKMH